MTLWGYKERGFVSKRACKSEWCTLRAESLWRLVDTVNLEDETVKLYGNDSASPPQRTTILGMRMGTGGKITEFALIRIE